MSAGKNGAPLVLEAQNVALECALRIVPTVTGRYIVQCKPPDGSPVISAPVDTWRAACALGAELVNQMARDVLERGRELSVIRANG